VAYEKILILESTWAEDLQDYIKDSRSAAGIYPSFDSLLSMHKVPAFAIHRPLLDRYLEDIKQFVSLPANARQMNIVILSAHGSYTRVQKGDKKVSQRRLDAIDGEIKLSKDIHLLKGRLKRTVFILDACVVGSRVKGFQRASGALGVVGFSKIVDWADSAVFVLALLLHIQTQEILQKPLSTSRPLIRHLVNDLRQGTYKSLSKALGLEAAWADS
jgi:hypothetical protein